MLDGVQAEVAVLFTRPWWGDGTKRFVGETDVEVGIALGRFLVKLYKDGGRVLEFAVKRCDGTTETVSGARFERESGWQKERLS